MSKLRTGSPLNWFRPLAQGDGGPSGPRMVAFAPAMFRAAMTLCAGLIVCFGWYFEDRLQSYRVGYPSPRDYYAQSSARFEDREATEGARELASGQIVGVRVRDDTATELVVSRINALKERGSADFAGAELRQLLGAISDDRRSRIFYTSAAIAEEIFDKSAGEAEQTARIWEKLDETDMAQGDRNIAFQLLDAMLRPTVAEDEQMAMTLRGAIARHVPAVVREIRAGRLILAKDAVVTPETAELLREQGYPDATVPWKTLSFVLLVTFIWCLWITWIGTKQDIKLTPKEWLFVGLVLAIGWVVQRAFASSNIDALPILAVSGWLFLTLLPAFAFQAVLGGCIIGYLLAFPGMASQIAVGCIICGVASGLSFLIVHEGTSRIMIWRNIFSLGIWVTCASFFSRWGMGMDTTWEMLGVCLVLCAVWSSIVVAVLPLWETLFGMISPLRLLEMSHPSQPLLKRLQLEAPGTYHHVVTVATLAEAVADKLGLNGLLARTGAYYHDIGKLKRPHYFVENQSFGNNIHDRLAPQESAKMLIAHVEEGLKLADEYKVPDAIKEFIREHHGTTCLTYFYQKAVNKVTEEGGDPATVDKAAFTYSGPPPRRAETALLMMADSIEAALKGLKDPLSSRASIEEFVGGIIRSKLMAGQFADVDFSFRDLTEIRQAFIDVLMSMYHTREIKPLGSEKEKEQPTEKDRALS